MPDSESNTAPRRHESWASTPGTRASMQSNRGRDTTPEIAVRRRLHALGLRYRVSVRPNPTLRRTADIVFVRARVAVFIDGCFWHGCPEHYQAPVRNGGFWLEKRLRNRSRDAETDANLRASGWTVLRFWEHQVESAPDDVVSSIIDAVCAASPTLRTRPRTHGAQSSLAVEPNRSASSSDEHDDGSSASEHSPQRGVQEQQSVDTERS